MTRAEKLAEFARRAGISRSVLVEGFGPAGVAVAKGKATQREIDAAIEHGAAVTGAAANPEENVVILDGGQLDRVGALVDAGAVPAWYALRCEGCGKLAAQHPQFERMEARYLIGCARFAPIWSAGAGG